jgi:putative solute:sodium symporter small subunit
MSALIAFAVVTLLTHIYPMYFLFPGLTEFTMFGFPAHYFLTLIIGWLVLMPVYWIYINVSEKIDDEIQATEELEATPAGKRARGGAE